MLGKHTLRNAPSRRHSVAWAVTMLCWPCLASAIDFNTGSDLKLRWDNTVKYSAAYRTKQPSATLTSPALNPNNVNQDDGDLNFKRGLISNRFDLFSEFDASYKSVGLRLTGAGWYDQVYNQGNDNPGLAGGAFPNQFSVAQNQFVRDTVKVHGRGAEILDAFVFGSMSISDTSRASVRLGRHGMVWGETLFFGANGIAGGMMPVDVVKLVSVPNTQFKEAIRPVPMVSGQWQITPDSALGAYYQFRWERSRIPTVGSYFSISDAVPDGGERIFVPGPNVFGPRLPDARPSHSGQGGIQFRTRVQDYDLGAYFIRFHDKTPQAVIGFGGAGPQDYRMAYAQGITSLGLSASRTFGDVNFATEVSMRRNQPLTSSATADLSGVGSPAPDNFRNTAYPLGKTAHVNVSALWSIAPNPLFSEGSLVAEIGWNRVLSVMHNAQALEPNSTRDAVALRTVLQATYRQVAPGLDLAPQLGLGWAPRGSRSSITATAMPQNNNGDLSLGVDATYLDVWRASLSFTHYFGSAGSFLEFNSSGHQQISYKQASADRDFVALSLRRSF